MDAHDESRNIDEVEPADIAVISNKGRPLTPCRPMIAEREVRFGRARWVHEKLIRLTYEPSRISRYKKAVLARDNYTCVWCGHVATTVDHIIPWSRGGSWFVHNLMAACLSCNQDRLDTDARDYFERILERIPNPKRVWRLIRFAERNEYVTRQKNGFVPPRQRS